MGPIAFRRLRRPLRLLLGAMAVAPLFAASLEAHTGPSPHDGDPATTWLSPEAQHPGQPHHLEASQAVRSPGCPACILQLQGACAGIATTPALVAPAAAEAVPQPPPVAPSLQPRHCATSRGPPPA